MSQKEEQKGSQIRKEAKAEKGISSLDLHNIVYELQSLVNAKIDKIYQAEQKKLLIEFHVPGTGKVMLAFVLPSFIFIEEKKDEHSNPTSFAMLLRKYLSNSRLRSIEQQDFERAVVLRFEKQEESGKDTFNLIVELFSHGNFIFTDNNLKILACLEEQRLKSRQVVKGEKYQFPTKGGNILKMSIAEMQEAVQQSSKDTLVKIIAVDFSLGGQNAEKVCELANLSKDLSKTDKIDFEKLHAALKSILTEKKHDNYLAYAKSLYGGQASTPRVANRFSSKVDKIARMLEMQVEKIEVLQKEIEELSAKAEYIYSNYQSINLVLLQLRKARETHSWKQIKEKLKEYNGPVKILDIKEKDGKIVLEI